MKTGLCLGVIASAIMGLAGAGLAQIESHCLPPELPPVMLPSWVTAPPPVESQEVSAAPKQPAAKAQKPAPEAAPAGRPDATTLDQMCKDAREAIRLAETGKFKEAAEKGQALLTEPREKFRDYTWDYLGNATAWSAIQSGDLAGAAQAHGAAAARIDDPAVAEYHRIAAAMLGQTRRPAAELKDYATYQGELRKRLADRVDSLKQLAAAAPKGAIAAHRDLVWQAHLTRLREAYDKLRVLIAVDPGGAKQEWMDSFRQASAALTTRFIPAAIKEGQQMQQHLEEVAASGYAGHGMTQKDWGKWNADVNALWAKVREIKGLCRVYDRLAQMQLAGAGEARQQFQAAHELLFTRSKQGLVWQETGHTRVFNDINQTDARQRVPWQETRITPWGVAPGSGGQVAMPGAKPLENRMQPMQSMNGQMQDMNGQMQDMNGQMQQMQPMNGRMQPAAPATPKR